jgi:tetratricopeptide (TPR) repeat protein
MRDRSSFERQVRSLDAFLDNHPQEASAYVQRGMLRFKLAQIEAAIADFDCAEGLNPAIAPYLWQRGLAYYYADQFAAGARQFEIDLAVNGRDAEETIWRYLCLARLKTPLEAKNALKLSIGDPRPIFEPIYALFTGRCTPDEVLRAGKRDRDCFYSQLYVGLYWEAQGDRQHAQQHICQAATAHHLDDYMWDLAWVHGELRGWLS